MRTKGATSNILVPLSELTARFQPGMMIPVARRFADQNGLLGAATPANLVKLVNNPAAPEQKAEPISVVEFSEHSFPEIATDEEISAE